MTKHWVVPPAQQNTRLRGLERKLGLQMMKADSKLEPLGLYRKRLADQNLKAGRLLWLLGPQL